MKRHKVVHPDRVGVIRLLHFICNHTIEQIESLNQEIIFEIHDHIGKT